MIMAAIQLGAFPPLQGPALVPGLQTAFVRLAADAGLDHVCTGDHVSFFVGAGFDGLVSAASLAAVHPTIPVYVAVYLLPLRHPTLVARQIADLELLAPSRLTLGVGIGGEDPHEYAVCGIDPRTRGQRMDECLTVVRELMTGTPVTFHGEFFDLDDAVILPAPRSRVPLIVGGRSDAAVHRAAVHGDGWIGVWNSARRFAEVTAAIDEQAAAAGRHDHPRAHAMQVWCGIAPERDDARKLLSTAMERFYQIPFDRFERYSPYGTPAAIAEFLAPYVAAGCTTFNLIPQSPDIETAVEGAAEVKRLLADA
jgi:alkanesulfonate monooxygenase SsuD/methylene tetrahydromethanopterin reductase-like flavin-dependent oxidoreductase (luciferase family)